MADYTTVNDLSRVVLEESWVLGVEARPSSLVMDVDFVVTTNHPLYRVPLPGETYGTVRGSMFFEGVESLEWSGQGTPPVIDLDNEMVYGNIDAMSVEEDVFTVEGNFGHIRVKARHLRVAYN